VPLTHLSLFGCHETTARRVFLFDQAALRHLEIVPGQNKKDGGNPDVQPYYRRNLKLRLVLKSSAHPAQVT
jgi:hypothetical protein